MHIPNSIHSINSDSMFSTFFTCNKVTVTTCQNVLLMPRAADFTSVALPAIAFTSLPPAKLSAFMVLAKLLADLSYATLAFRGYEWFESHLYPLSAQHFRPGSSHPDRRSCKFSKVRHGHNRNRLYIHSYQRVSMSLPGVRGLMSYNCSQTSCWAHSQNWPHWHRQVVNISNHPKDIARGYRPPHQKAQKYLASIAIVKSERLLREKSRKRRTNLFKKAN